MMEGGARRGKDAGNRESPRCFMSEGGRGGWRLEEGRRDGIWACSERKIKCFSFFAKNKIHTTTDKTDSVDVSGHKGV